MTKRDVGQNPVLDVAIIGAGLSGLTTAYNLRDKTILVIEKEKRAGGRILTRQKHGVYYDLGAVFSYDTKLVPAEFQFSNITVQDKPIGIFYRGKSHYGKSIPECLSTLDLGEEAQKAIEAFRADRTLDANSLPHTAYTQLNAFFQTIHPGDMGEYLAHRQRDSLVRQVVPHYETGNAQLIQQMADCLGSRIRLSAEVLAVEDKKEHVVVSVRSGKQNHSILARTAILSLPGPVALSLLETMTNGCRKFLKRLRYSEGTVVALGFEKTEPTGFSYIVTPDMPMNTVLNLDTPSEDIQLLLVYYVGEKSARVTSIDDRRIVQQTLAALTRMQIAEIAEERLLFSDVCRWPMMGPIISADSYGVWDERITRPSPRIFLTGEYTYVHPIDPFPYGTAPAIVSGRKVALRVKDFLEREAAHKEAFPVGSPDRVREGQRLSVARAAELGLDVLQHPVPMLCCPPPPAKPYGYGDLVPVGFLTRALCKTIDPGIRDIGVQLRRWLLENRQRKLWSFHSGGLMTATDSALVLLGLEGPAVLEALEAIEIFSDGKGGFYPQLWSGLEEPDKMLASPETRHWCQSDYATTCLIRGLKRQSDLHVGFGEEQLVSGFSKRSGLFFANPYLVDWTLALALSRDGQDAHLRHRLLGEILAGMNDDGSFGHYDIAFSTALAILSLAALDSCGQIFHRSQLRLLDFMESNGAWPEATPFFSSQRVDSRHVTTMQIAWMLMDHPEQVLQVNGERHAVSLYEDQAGLISTAVAALALSAEPCSTAPSAPVEGIAPSECHPRYRCGSLIEYVAEFALPPYLRSDLTTP